MHPSLFSRVIRSAKGHSERESNNLSVVYILNVHLLFAIPPAELCVRVRVSEGGEYERHSFRFSLGGLPQSLPSIDWVSLTSSETTFPHVCIHKLEKEDNLSYFLATLSSIPAARAMILVNPKSTSELSMKFRSSEESPPVPLLVVTSETGAELLKLVEEHTLAVEVRVGVSDRVSGRPQSLELDKRESCKCTTEVCHTQLHVCTLHRLLKLFTQPLLSAIYMYVL